MRREYYATLQLDRASVYQLSRFNNYTRRYSLGNYDQSALAGFLGGTSIVLSIVSLVGGTMTGIAALFAGVISAMSNSEKSTLETVMLHGEDGLEDIVDLFDANPTWQKVEILTPMLEFVNEGFRVVQGAPEILRVQINNSWVV